MGKYTIYASIFRTKQSKSSYFSLRNHYGNSATVHLSPEGIYTMEVNGYEDDYVIENRAKRDPQYKMAVQKVSNEMIAEFDEEHKFYVLMSKRALRMIERKDIEMERSKIVLEHYQRRKFDIAMPSEDDIKRLLDIEANGLFYKSASNQQEISQYIEKNKSSKLQERRNNWRDLQKLHDDIEKANEEKTNSSYLRIYNSKVKIYDDRITGEPSVIQDAFSQIQNSVSIPYSVELDYNYSQTDKTIEIDVELTDLVELSMPIFKVNLLASGKISVKKKLQKEIKSDIVDSQMCLMYYIASFAFSITPNIEKCRVSLYTKKKVDGLCWIEFQRKNFKFHTDPTDYTFTWPIVYNLGEVRGAYILQEIDASTFKSLIKEKIQMQGL